MIDWERVAELRDEIGPDDFDEVVELFLLEVGEVIERLRSGADPVRYEDELHFLKGSALNLGFAELGGLCQEGERRAAAGLAETVDIGAVIRCYDRSKTAFLSDMSAALAAAA